MCCRAIANKPPSTTLKCNTAKRSVIGPERGARVLVIGVALVWRSCVCNTLHMCERWVAIAVQGNVAVVGPRAVRGYGVVLQNILRACKEGDRIHPPVEGKLGPLTFHVRGGCAVGVLDGGGERCVYAIGPRAAVHAVRMAARACLSQCTITTALVVHKRMAAAVAVHIQERVLRTTSPWCGEQRCCEVGAGPAHGSPVTRGPVVRVCDAIGVVTRLRAP